MKKRTFVNLNARYLEKVARFVRQTDIEKVKFLFQEIKSLSSSAFSLTKKAIKTTGVILVAARLRHISTTKWGTRQYMNIGNLYPEGVK